MCIYIYIICQYNDVSHLLAKRNAWFSEKTIFSNKGKLLLLDNRERSEKTILALGSGGVVVVVGDNTSEN